MKVLIIDDSRVILKINSKTVSDLVPDAEIITFQSPLEAIESIQANNLKFDLALIDYNMEGMNGIELADTLAKDGVVDRGHISIVSANIQAAVKEKASQASFNFIDKPLKTDDLQAFLSMRGIL